MTRKIDLRGRFRIRAALAFGALGYLAAGVRDVGANAGAKDREGQDLLESASRQGRGAVRQSLRAVPRSGENCRPARKPAPPLIGDKFLDKWSDKTVGELLTLIATTMPDDGSVVLTDADAAALVAYILKANGFPDGPKDLDAEKSKDVVIVK